MIWVAVFPTLTLLNLTIGPLLKDSNPVLRTFVLATVAVPIVIYGAMPRLHRVRARILARRCGDQADLTGSTTEHHVLPGGPSGKAMSRMVLAHHLP
ncbi:MAG: hypothetical protein QOF53_995 [Nocardioidaceae bacterium]|jgi:antibiotic biosynthesis monooxygenase (ABM) superfamily enzyme|nr:hypothetical protein [Nocardioidaceae bacterium]